MQRELFTVPVGQAIHIEMSNERYHQCANWSHSQLKYLPDYPEVFEWKHILRREEFKVTRDMVKGTAGHAWLLEGIKPTLVPDQFLTKSGSLKPGGWDEVAAAFPGIPVLKRDELTELSYARDNCMADPEIRAYLETAGSVEHSLFSVDPDTGLPTRVRLDKLCRFSDGLEILDLKFSANSDDRWVEQQVTKMAYYSQAGMYWEHVERAYARPRRWVFLFVQNQPPFTPRLKELLDHDVDLGARHTRLALLDLRARLASGDWKGPGFGSVTPTHVAKWLWESDPKPVAPFSEFSEFSAT